MSKLTISELLNRLAAKRVRLRRDGDSLCVSAPGGAMTETVKAEIAEHKPLLLKALADRSAPIPPPTTANRQADLPLSYAQQRLWFLNAFETGNAYHMSLLLELRGTLDATALEQALDAIEARHDALRTVFVPIHGEPMQRILPSGDFALEVVDLTNGLRVDAEDAARARMAAFHDQPFDLEQGPLWRALLVRLAPQRHWLAVVMHHIASDGWSMGVLQRELSVLYRAFLHGESMPLPALPMQYADFALWQRQWLQGAVLEEQLCYWREQLTDALSLHRLPLDHPRPEQQRFVGAQASFTLDAELSMALRRLSRTQGTTLFITLLAGFTALLARHGGRRDWVIGAPIANREHHELEGLIGFFVNTLAMRLRWEGDPSFLELLAQAKEVAFGAYAHQHLPFERLVEELNPERSLSYEPLVQILFALQNTPRADLDLEDLVVARLPRTTTATRFELECHLWEVGDRMEGFWIYNTDLFEPATIKSLQSHFAALLRSAVAAPETPLSRLSLWGEGERARVLNEWNATERSYQKDRCVHQLFEAHVARNPEANALVFEDRELTYGQLNEAANRIAYALIKRGVVPDTPVGLCVERSPELIIGLLAILKAGGAYVPLDPDYPKTRLAFMLRDSGSPLLVTTRSLSRRFPEFEGSRLHLDDPGKYAAQPSTNPGVEVASEHLAYVIYTSGSTGRPKGVEVPHRAIMRLVCNADYCSFNNQRVFLQFAPVSFDAATFEIWGALLHGAQLILAPPGREALARIPALISQYGVTTAWLTASLFNQIVDGDARRLEGLDELLIGGEVLSPTHVAKASRSLPGTAIINGYGPTESTTFTCTHRIPSDQDNSAIPIGRPIANTRVYVLDEALQPQPIGIAGELCIAGDGLARGYLNRPELTAERFVEVDVFGRRERIYRTGDLARWRPDGNLEFLGRLDHQVKIRGFRIELGEIEAVLGAQPGIRETVVLARDDHPGDKCLVAYMVLDPNNATTTAALRRALVEQLPEYMIPAAFVPLEALPLTPNGKVDRAALPISEGERDPKSLIGPSDIIEVELMRIWEKMLGCFPVGVEDNFFELGGTSLLAVKLVERIRQVFKREVPVDAVWRHGGTIRGLAGLLRDQAGEAIWSHAVAFKSQGSRRPLFCPHIAGGNMFYYDNLARHLDSEQPVYGLPARGTDGREPPHETIESLAAHGIGLMRAVQPEGPFSLLGYCSGGVIAFEMARQLQSQGETVSLLALVDSVAPGFSLRGWIRLLAGAARGESWRFAQEYIYQAFMHPTGLRRLRHLRGLGETHRWALWSYRGGHYSGRTLLLRPSELTEDRGPALGWDRLIGEGLHVRTIQGQHGDLVKEPGVQALAEELERWLA